MPNNSLQYFVNKTYFDSGLVYGDFDFRNLSNSGLSIIPAEPWPAPDLSIIVNDPQSFWASSGFASFNGQQSVSMGGITDGSDKSFLMSYALPATDKENVFISSLSNSSGINFGINHIGYPYLEYYDEVLGAVTVCHTKRANKTGILYCHIGEYGAAVGVWDAQSNAVSKTAVGINAQNVKRSNNFSFGGGAGVDSGRFLSGRIGEIFIYNGGYATTSNYESAFVSGMSYGISSSIISGTISGQTGVLSGDIIAVNKIFTTFSGYASGTATLAEKEYFATHQSFVDFNNEVYHTFQQQMSSGFVTGFSMAGDFINSSISTSANNFFTYDSGYSVSYTITNFIPFILPVPYLNSYCNKIVLGFPADPSDIFSIYASSSPSVPISSINFRDIYLGNYDNNFYATASEDLQFSELYYNGQLQTPSSGVDILISGGKRTYNPQQDYFLSGNVIYGSGFYDNLQPYPFIADILPIAPTVMQTGNFPSGRSINGADFRNSLVFWNGQKLSSGIDFSGVNTLLFSGEPSGVLAIQSLSGMNILSATMSGVSGGLIDIPFNFISNTSEVWLNGLRLSKDSYYEEMGANFDFIENSSSTMYNLS